MTSSRVPILTACTLATLAGWDLPTHANPVHAPTMEPGVENSSIQADSAVVEPIYAIATPETLTTAQFTTVATESTAISPTEKFSQPTPGLPQVAATSTPTVAAVGLPLAVAPPEVLPGSEPVLTNLASAEAQTQPVFTQGSGFNPETNLQTQTPNLRLQTISVANASHLSSQSAESTKFIPRSAPPPARLSAALIRQPETLLAQSLAQTAVNSTFTDIQGHWAQDFIEYLADRNIVRGFPDRTFRPDDLVNRSQFAAMLQKAFPSTPGNNLAAFDFTDVPPSHWAYDAIQTAYRHGFLTKYPGNAFKPNQAVSRLQVITTLTQGLNLIATSEKPENLTTYFQDADSIPDYGESSVVAAIENRLIVNYPNLQRLNPNQAATRADAAAFIYQSLVKLGEAPPLAPTAMAARYLVVPLAVAVTPPAPDNPPLPESATPPTATVQDVQNRLQAVQADPLFGDIFGGSPGITVANPSGFGADNLTGFASATYQESVRGSEKDDGSLGFGIGFGDAQKAVGVELSYTIASFGSNRDFGTGGFNLKVHRRLATDTSIAVGWNGFLNLGNDNDFKDSLYGVVTQIFRTRSDINQPFSRVAVSAGLGNGQFRTVEDIEDDRGAVNPFGSIALRIARPVSFITEWTGQDLALGLSISPFKNFNLVITPALRDVLGEGDHARFVLGVGTSFKF
ncbi:MAG: S-layer homology domain-containing protein [Scytolyngbya sp. HA4215-MV1]|jgi:hypothetical protein|nr:S-layer homology domain-containing protein [Scytolyngbya sp. HA4215-MV1]